MPCALFSSSRLISSGSSWGSSASGMVRISSSDAAARNAARPDGPSHRHRDSGSRAASRRWARAPRRSWRRPSGGRSSAPAWRASDRAWPTCPCRSAPCRAGRRPGRYRHCVPHRRRSRRGLLHVALADHRAGFHRGVDLIAGAVEEPGVDEHHAVLAARMHSLRFTVVRRSSSMMPILRCIGARPRCCFDGGQTGRWQRPPLPGHAVEACG
jgi:hypothetical protein